MRLGLPRVPDRSTRSWWASFGGAATAPGTGLTPTDIDGLPLPTAARGQLWPGLRTRLDANLVTADSDTESGRLRSRVNDSSPDRLVRQQPAGTGSPRRAIRPGAAWARPLLAGRRGTTSRMALVRVCDLHDLSEWWVEVTATRRFGLDGRFHEVDLCAEHDAALDHVLASYLAGARRT